MKENYSNNELKKLLEGVDLPSADKAWQKMSSLLDQAADGGAGNTAVGHSLVFKTIIWLNSIFLVLTTVVVGAMYKNKSQEPIALIMEEPLPPLTVHLPPFEGEANESSDGVAQDSAAPTIEFTQRTFGPWEFDNENTTTIKSISVPMHGQAEQASSSNEIVTVSNNLTIAQEKDIKNLGESMSPGVSIKNDERSPQDQLTAGEDLVNQLAPKTTDADVSDQVVNQMVNDSLIEGDLLIAPEESAEAAPLAINAALGKKARYVLIKTGIGLNEHTAFSYFLKQMQFGAGYSIPLNARHGLQIEAMYNPVAIPNMRWTEIKEVSFVPYENDITARKLNYISVPVMLKHRMNLNWSTSLGLQQSYLVGQVGDVNSQIQIPPGTALVSSYESINPYSDQNRFAKWNTALIIDFEYRIERVLLSARLQQSLTDITNDAPGRDAFDSYTNLTLSAGYLIGK